MGKRYYLPSFLLFTLTACADHQQQTDQLLRASAESLAKAASMKALVIELVEARVNEMVETSYLSQIATPWQQKIKRITAFTRTATDHVKRLRKQVQKEFDQREGKKTVSSTWSMQAADLYHPLTLFRDSLLAVDPMIRTEFGNSTIF